MTDQITQELARLEHRHVIKVLYAIAQKAPLGCVVQLTKDDGKVLFFAKPTASILSNTLPFIKNPNTADLLWRKVLTQVCG